jgi:hypothetical protein
MRAPRDCRISRVVNTRRRRNGEQVLLPGRVSEPVTAATALGYGAQWITEWYGYSQARARAALSCAGQ